jgi:predicted transposase YdaD
VISGKPECIRKPHKSQLESVPAFLALGLSLEQIAQGLDLDIEQVKQAAVFYMGS